MSVAVLRRYCVTRREEGCTYVCTCGGFSGYINHELVMSMMEGTSVSHMYWRNSKQVGVEYIKSCAQVLC